MQKQRCGYQVVIGLTPLIMLEPSAFRTDAKGWNIRALYEVRRQKYSTTLGWGQTH